MVLKYEGSSAAAREMWKAQRDKELADGPIIAGEEDPDDASDTAIAMPANEDFETGEETSNMEVTRIDRQDRVEVPKTHDERFMEKLDEKNAQPGHPEDIVSPANLPKNDA